MKFSILTAVALTALAGSSPSAEASNTLLSEHLAKNVAPSILPAAILAKVQYAKPESASIVGSDGAHSAHRQPLRHATDLPRRPPAMIQHGGTCLSSRHFSQSRPPPTRRPNGFSEHRRRNQPIRTA